MYQPSNPYSNDGATKISPGAGAKNTGSNRNGGGYGNGAAYGSGYGAGGFGAGGYGGAAGYGDGSMYGGAGPGQEGAQNGSMYGGGSVYGGGGGAASMMGDMNENIVVTKLFSSRRDLDRVASAVDFSRRFDSNWGSYRSAGADGYGGSIYRNNTGAGEGSLMNLGGSRGVVSLTDRGVGRAGEGPDGGAPAAAAAAESREARPPPKTAVEQAPREPSTKKLAAGEEAGARQPVKPKPASPKKPVEVKPAAQAVPPKPADAASQNTSRALPMQESPRNRQAEQKQTPKTQPPAKTMTSREVVPSGAKPVEVPPLDDIPLLADDVLPKKKAPTPAEVKQMPTPRELPPPQREVARETEEPAKGPNRPMRPRSRPHSRPQSRMTSMSVVEFPQADEVKDEMVADGLKAPERDAALAAAREEQKRQREEASRHARLERAKQRQQQEDQQKQREEETRRAREAKAEEERLKKERIAKMDEETRQQRAAALAARERQREEEKRRFEEAKKAEEEKEAARAAAAIAERQRLLEEKEASEEKAPRPTSRPRSRRPVSRPNSNLRGPIPEQPPDLVAGQIKDPLAEDKLSKPTNTVTRTTPASGTADAVSSNTSQRAADHPQKREPQQVVHRREVEVSRQHTSHESTPASQQAHATKPAQSSVRTDEGSTQQQQPTPATQRERNMVKTFVLMEAVRDSNHAVQSTPDSITYRDQTINVTELKVREEDNFNYNSTVVHDVREAACHGYNSAVLSMETANTVSRFESPVWSILNRIVRTLLKENSSDAGELQDNFELTCAIGYLYRDKVKDLLERDGDAPFTKVAVNPSPIYGPRLTNLRYDAVTDPAQFEEMLSGTLSRSTHDTTVAGLTEGVVAAFVLVKQCRETEGKQDIYLSSLIVASCGEDPLPYQSAISHTRNEYATVFHLVLGGPSCTCFMLNVADDDAVRKSGDANQQSVPDGIETALALLAQMAALQNYDLRSGSVRRFIKYLERSHANARQRLAKESDEAQRRKVERYVKEQERLLEDAYGLLRDANIQVEREL
ncbi:hypothetical protein ABB37_02396 [Leptomonas pyrrhocoris]|uniref:Uncharacterized protein n=1 Tax=Leptomonas pyrrhocoris TaxID=157538 RepID=A0A0M9G861_LEPPY|nr:hypothetical protein ABB37_02396 [Leptomonas pyrrhocoris]XP_015662859.1 hypothetical protein ABB37_02396 [Leptomonas pyrrhocoris]KPA84419.1 hypothetical protein ABB37_02396 [Leptomonas pyrrhocoris]KPA84420.1 hypothetical protein ABB37_02396 [Leptomonas pyrrhocoris]|eukprot:XP_015662858.1 hypothetical protein ABB37_02396 [Leptomonas pyrrhocoris]